MIQQEFTLNLLAWPNPSSQDFVAIKHKPVQSVDEIRYWTDAGEVTLDAAAYYLDLGRRHVVFTDPSALPAVARRGVDITYTAGYGTSSAHVPRICRRAIALLAGKWFYDPASEDTTSRDMQAYRAICRTLMPTHVA